MQYTRRSFIGRLVPAALACPSAFGQGQADLRTQCVKRLQMLFEAIEAWRRTHSGDYPPDLMALLTDGFLHDRSFFDCPGAKAETSLQSAPRATLSSTSLEPLATYEYELESKMKPNMRDAVGMPDPSRRAWKLPLLQGPLGDHVPILRCLWHGLPYINLPRTGKPYESGSEWEYKFVDILPEVYAMPWLAVHRSPSIHNYVAARSPDLPRSSIDLKDAANALPGDPWLDGSEEADSLAELPPTITIRGDEREEIFDSRYLIQVCGACVSDDAWKQREAFAEFPSYPRQSRAIKLACRKGTSISLLHATAYPAQPGTTVGCLLFRFPDGTEKEKNLVYGGDTRVWRHEKPDGASVPTPVWSGTTAAKTSPIWLARLFYSSFPVDAESAVDQPVELFLVADKHSTAGPFIAALNSYI